MKKTVFGAVLLVCCAALVAVSAVPADQGKGVGDAKKVEAKAEKYTPATTIDFAGELGLSFEGLTTLGARIETARHAADPVALAVAAVELSAAENVAGKKASLTSDALAKEAVDLAKLRDHSGELRMVAELVKDQNVARDLHAAAEKAADREQKEAKSADEESRGARYLRVRNRTDEGVDVYVDGRFIGHVRRDGRETFPIHMRHERVRLWARHHHRSWGPVDIEGEYDTYTWTLED